MNITNVDLSSVVIEQMTQSCCRMVVMVVIVVMVVMVMMVLDCWWRVF